MSSTRADVPVDLAKNGMRVIALAFKKLEPSDGSEVHNTLIFAHHKQSQIVDKPRAWAESNLCFAGFIAFRCLVRKDSKDILQVGSVKATPRLNVVHGRD